MRQRRYDVPIDFALPDLSRTEGVAEASSPVEQTLEATYFDTSDHRLAAAGVSLRRRTGGDDDGWHLDLPSAIDKDASHELRVGLGRAVRTVPKRFRSTVAGLTGTQVLAPVATVTTRRSLHRLLDEDGAMLARVADDAVQAVRARAGGPHPRSATQEQPVIWRDVEVELVDGSPSMLDRVGKRLVNAGACRSARRSELADVLGLPVHGPRPPVQGTDQVQLLVLHRLATELQELRARDPLAREDLPEGVHTMRVAVRRLRSTLATCRPFLDRSATDPLRQELAWLGDALGEARDAEIRRSRLDKAIDALVEERHDLDWDDVRVRPALWSTLVERHEQARAALAEVLVSQRYAALLDRLGALVAEPPWTDRAYQRVEAAYLRRVEREVRRLHARMQAAEDPTLTQEERARALHEARKATKRARYAVEPLGPVYGSAATTLTSRLSKLQTALGHHQDTVVTRAYLLDLSRSKRPPLDPAAALIAGALIERESLAAQRYDRHATKAWHKVARRIRLDQLSRR